MSSPAQKIHQVAVLLFPGADLLDFASPVGILSHINYNRPLTSAAFSPAFKIHHLAKDHSAVALGEAKTVITPDMTFDEAREKIDEFDILVIPGGPPNLVLELAKSDGPEVWFVREFACIQPRSSKEGRSGGGERLAFSICDGSLFLGAVGALSGLQATSHHSMLGALKELDGSIEVVDSTADGRARRYVDGGVNGAGVRVVTSGGVTCGLDAGLYVVEMLVGRELAEDWAEMNEYVWRRAKVDV